MAAEKKPNFPSKPCPKCGKFLHIKLKKHAECGWGMNGKAGTASAPTKSQVKPAPAATNGQQISKMEAVRRILQQHGNETKPLEIQDELKKKYQISMDTTVISTYKGTILKKAAGGKPAKKPSPAAAKAVAATSAVRTGGGISLDDIKAVKALTDRMGAEKVQQLAAVLAK